jgi:hypothetical protein
MNKNNYLQKILNYNLKIQNVPELINKNNVPQNFRVTYENIVDDAVSYFFNDPMEWHLPAKNYFVRICIALYNKKYFSSVIDALDQDWLLPYDDTYTNKYSLDKNIYNEILKRINLFIEKPWLMNGYNKTIEIFGKCYNHPLNEIKLTVGYNKEGQDFFDLLYLYKKYIFEFFFSFWHTMRNDPLDEEEIFKQLSSCNQYKIPANLLLNSEEECESYKYLIEKAQQCTYLHSVTVLDINTAENIKKMDIGNKLSIHLSTLGAQYININDLDPQIISCVNIHEPSLYTEHHKQLIKKCRNLNINIKYIANRNCIWNKWETMSELTGKNIKCQNNCQLQCKQLLKEYPWLDLCRTNLQKEMLMYWHPDLIKLSTRELSTDNIRKMLKYWTGLDATNHICNVVIPESKFDVYIDWIKYRTNKCNGKCAECLECKKFYDLLTK